VSRFIEERHLDQDQTLRLLARETRMIQAFIRAMVCDFHLAEDILQEVFVVALQKRDQFVVGTNFGAWVREIARRVSFAKIRKSGKGDLTLTPEVLDAIEDSFDVDPDRWELERRALGACVGGLPEESRRILTLRYVEDTPITQIASAVKRSTDGVKGLLKRLRQRLADCVSARLKESGFSGGTIA
jgi:RNA polymerase sigma-70 factor (ECF subfamily)